MSQSNFNPAQLATWQQARDLARQLSSGPTPVGNGVRPESKDNSVSGIYIPEWMAGPASFAEPNFKNEQTGEEFFFLHFRFNNGAEGMNVGLIASTLQRYANSPVYAMSLLADEAADMARR